MITAMKGSCNYWSRLSAFALVLSTLALLSCEAKLTSAQSAVNSSIPSKEIYHVLQQFLAADTLDPAPKVHVAFLRPDTLAGDLSVYLLDVYNSNGELKILPLTTWRVDEKIIFVFTGLEAITSGGDTTYHHLIRATEAANKENTIWCPPFRCWRLDVQGQKVTSIDRQVRISPASYPFIRFAPPPPPPKFR
ncbi:hypothetical protein [Hymenobacter cellulosivorans]|uniref:Lipoprotein n=1 Tax=Hymenobacter cellulosivorans TaxID=2932249 RepID=A0ABY4F6F0_9BACT|nr:hypothetical protein [Hymenobacter cellulosivorans]UOQ51603.1 hypothetical protein MUN80_17790 [Hymenobacter cellulosivorans]